MAICKADEYAAKAAKYAALAKAELRKETERKNKARNHRLIQLGVSVESVLGPEVDKGLFLGLIMEYKGLFNSDSGLSPRALELKNKGDALIAQREAAELAEREARKNKKPDSCEEGESC